MDLIVNLLIALIAGCTALLFGMFLWVLLEVLVFSVKTGRLP